MLKQVCIIPFRRDFLLKFNNLAPNATGNYRVCGYAQVLEHGDKVKMVMSEHRTYSVDTPDDLAFVSTCMENDILMKQVSPYPDPDRSLLFYFRQKIRSFLLDPVLSELPSDSPVFLR